MNRADPVTAAEGVVVLTERIWPAFEHIDTSSGALGSAVRRTLEDLVQIQTDTFLEAQSLLTTHRPTEAP